jgi:hypothetical protein
MMHCVDAVFAHAQSGDAAAAAQQAESDKAAEAARKVYNIPVYMYTCPYA